MNEGLHQETTACLGSGQGQDLKAVIRFPDSTLEATIWVVFWGSGSLCTQWFNLPF